MLGFLRRMGRRDLAGEIHARRQGTVMAFPGIQLGMQSRVSGRVSQLGGEPVGDQTALDEGLRRRNITCDSAGGDVCDGFGLLLSARLVEAVDDHVAPVANAMIEVWHCNAEGYYSGENRPGIFDGRDADWLRGYQISDHQGDVKFETIYPGWTTGHAVHICARVRLWDDTGSRVVFDDTVKMYFKDGLTTKVGMFAPYTSNFQARTLNANDADYTEAVEVALSDAMDLEAGGYLWPIVTLTETCVEARFHLVLAAGAGGRRLICPV